MNYGGEFKKASKSYTGYLEQLQIDTELVENQIDQTKFEYVTESLTAINKTELKVTTM